MREKLAAEALLAEVHRAVVEEDPQHQHRDVLRGHARPRLVPDERLGGDEHLVDVVGPVVGVLGEERQLVVGDPRIEIVQADEHGPVEAGALLQLLLEPLREVELRAGHGRTAG
jgi:hypothetical protein